MYRTDLDQRKHLRPTLGAGQPQKRLTGFKNIIVVMLLKAGNIEIMTQANSQQATRQGLLVAPDETIRFTKNDRPKYARHFAKAGIDINQVKTLEQFDLAWDKARPYFFEFLASLTDHRPPSIERDLLIATVKGDEEKVAELSQQLRLQASSQ